MTGHGKTSGLSRWSGHSRWSALSSSIAKDLRWRLADPTSLLLWVGVPLLIGGLMTLAFGRGSTGTAPRPHLLVASDDDPILKEMLSGMADRMRIENVALEDGRRRIAAGDASALLIAPKHFGASFIFDQPAALELVTNPGQQILPAMLHGELQARFVDGQFYIRRLPADVLMKLQGGTDTDLLTRLDAATRASTDPRAKFVRDALFPLLLSVESELTPRQAAQAAAQGPAAAMNVGALLFPGVLFMALMFMAQGLSYDIWREKDQGTLARLLCSPLTPSAFLLAKTIAGAIWMALVSAGALALGAIVFDLPLTVLPAALLWSASSGACLLALFYVVQMLASTSRGAHVLTSSILFPLMMLGGAFFPLDMMPRSLAAVGRWTPNGLAVTQLDDILKNSVRGGSLALAALVLGLTGTAFFFLATRMLRSRFVTA